MNESAAEQASAFFRDMTLANVTPEVRSWIVGAFVVIWIIVIWYPRR
ncbi:hypothetical protein [uncultured Phenylobacterium sp.]|nr:hypothetical protein [uncultured Phenylobacterium sp.]